MVTRFKGRKTPKAKYRKPNTHRPVPGRIAQRNTPPTPCTQCDGTGECPACDESGEA